MAVVDYSIQASCVTIEQWHKYASLVIHQPADRQSN